MHGSHEKATRSIRQFNRSVLRKSNVYIACTSIVKLSRARVQSPRCINVARIGCKKRRKLLERVLETEFTDLGLDMSAPQ